MRVRQLWLGFRSWLLDWRSHGLTLLMVALIYAGVHLWQTRHLPGGPAPAFSAPLASPHAISRIDLEPWRTAHPSRAVALHFWAEWCPICRLEEGSISAVQHDWPVLGVAMQSGDAARVQAVLTQRGLAWQTAIDADGSITRRYGLSSVPAFIVLDTQGHIRFAEIGYISETGMRLRLWWAQNF